MQPEQPWILVTGACQKLGKAIAATLSELGYPVVIHYNINKEKAEHLHSELTEKGGKVEIIQGDFSSYESTSSFIDEYLNRFKKTLCVINNVGNYEMNGVLTTLQATEYMLFQVNFHAPMQLTRAVLPQLKRSKGSIINIGTAGLYTYRADSQAPLYYATKVALFSATKSLAKELAPSFVRVNMISPGHLEHSLSRPESWDTLPMKRPASHEDVCNSIVFLIENTYVTGQNIEIAGGYAL